MLSFLPVASAWPGQWGGKFLEWTGHYWACFRKGSKSVCGGGWIEAKKVILHQSTPLYLTWLTDQ